MYGAKEPVPAFEVFDVVSCGVAEMGHSAAYYWKSKAAEIIAFRKVLLKVNIIYG